LAGRGQIYLAVLSSLYQMYSSRQLTLGHWKTQVIQAGGLAEGQRQAIPSNVIAKLMKRNVTQYYSLFLHKCTLSSASKSVRQM